MNDVQSAAVAEKYMTEREVSDLTGIALSTLRNWRVLGKGPRYVKPGGTCVRYPLSSLLAFCEGRKIKPSHDV
ncbi:MAG: helix-turn-helix domain-containing protein [Actinobacteria bacterium]|nr:helix-turn-helix domain-containing protein [Actinomycetota bacterium]